VFDSVTSDQLAGFLSHHVHVIASGATEPTDLKPTVDSSFVSTASNPALLLPSPKGLAIEPVRVVIVGASSAHVRRATRDVLAAIVERERRGSTGVARLAGLAGRGPSDSVVVGGGALIPLAILVLLLARHAPPSASTHPFAFIKAYVQGGVAHK
jgi:hypothetical protein